MQAEAFGWHTIPVVGNAIPKEAGKKLILHKNTKLSQVTAQLYRIPVASIGLRPNPETGAGC